MAMLIALLGAGFVACSDDDKDDDKDACAEVTCDAAADANAVSEKKADGDSCSCVYSCKTGYKAKDASVKDKTIVCEVEQQACSSACDTVANATATQAADCSCTYACNNGFKPKDASVKDKTIVCEAEQQACSTACDTVANATATQAADCSCTYACNDGYKAADESVKDKNIVCNFVKLENDADCMSDAECISNFCDTNEEGDGKCRDKGGEDPTVYKDCNDDNECDASKEEYCVAKKCRSAASFHMKECDANSADFCVGNALVSCKSSESGDLYDYDKCPEKTSCKAGNDGKFACVADSSNVGDCSAANEGEKRYTACSDKDDYGYYTTISYDKCTKKADGSYGWESKSESCGALSCLPDCLNEGCTAKSFC